MRGIAHQPDIQLFEDRYKLKPACIAVYPMYKGLAQLVGMTKIEGAQTIQEQFETYLNETLFESNFMDKYGPPPNSAILF